MKCKTDDHMDMAQAPQSELSKCLQVSKGEDILGVIVLISDQFDVVRRTRKQ